MEEKQVYESNNEMLVLQVCGILKENDIPFIRREEGLGAYLTTTWGSNDMLKKIYVNSEDYNKAENLIKIFCLNIQNTEDGEIPEELKEDETTGREEEMQEDINKYHNMKRFLTAWVPIGSVAVFIIVFIIVFLQGNN